LNEYSRLEVGVAQCQGGGYSSGSVVADTVEAKIKNFKRCVTFQQLSDLVCTVACDAITTQ